MNKTVSLFRKKARPWQILSVVCALYWRLYAALHKGWRKQFGRFMIKHVRNEKEWKWQKQILCSSIARYRPELAKKGMKIWILDYFLCKAFLGASADTNYLGMCFFRKGFRYRNRTFCTYRLMFCRDIINDVGLKDLFYDKTKAAELWQDWFRRRWCRVSPDAPISPERLREVLNGGRRLVVKPIDLYSGKGIFIQEISNNKDLESAAERLNRLNAPHIVEEYVEQKGLLHEFNPSTVNTIRVATIKHTDGTVDVFQAFLRVGRAGSIVDNVSAGGIYFDIDIRTGSLAEGMDDFGNRYESHPDSLLKIAGTQVPHWEQVMEFCRSAHRHAPPGYRLAGWDVCLSEDGLRLIECNYSPGLSAPRPWDPNPWATIRKLMDEVERSDSPSQNSQNTSAFILPSLKHRQLTKRSRRQMTAEVIAFCWKTHGRFQKGWRRAYAEYMDRCVRNEREWKKERKKLQRILSDQRSDLLSEKKESRWIRDFWWTRVLINARAGDNYFGMMLFRNTWGFRRRCMTNGRLDFSHRFLNSREAEKVTQSKIRSAEAWAPWYHRAWRRVTSDSPMSTEDLYAVLNGKTKIVVKPNNGYGGKGIFLLEIRDEDALSAAVDRLNALSSPHIAEEYVEQTGLLHDLNPSSVNDIRVITLRHPDGDIETLQCYLRVGRSGSVVDNSSSGGIFFPIDFRRGIIWTGFDFFGNTYTTHPDTRTQITGLCIPRWDDVLEYCVDAHRHAPDGLCLIGWDICLSDDCIDLIEVNGRPGFHVPAPWLRDPWKKMRKILDEWDRHRNQNVDTV